MSGCGFEGNPDTYGLGVRLDAYLSWASITIASTFFPSARKDLLDALVIFSIAFFAAIIVEYLDDETYTVELIIMGCMFFGGIVATSISLGQDVTLGVLPGASNPAVNGVVYQAIASNGNPPANGGSTAPGNATPAGKANPSLARCRPSLLRRRYGRPHILALLARRPLSQNTLRDLDIPLGHAA